MLSAAVMTGALRVKDSLLFLHVFCIVVSVLNLSLCWQIQDLISCKLSPFEKICMICQSRFCWQSKQSIYKILFSLPSVKEIVYLQRRVQYTFVEKKIYPNNTAPKWNPSSR